MVDSIVSNAGNSRSPPLLIASHIHRVHERGHLGHLAAQVTHATAYLTHHANTYHQQHHLLHRRRVTCRRSIRSATAPIDTQRSPRLFPPQNRGGNPGRLRSRCVPMIALTPSRTTSTVELPLYIRVRWRLGGVVGLLHAYMAVDTTYGSPWYRDSRTREFSGQPAPKIHDNPY